MFVPVSALSDALVFCAIIRLIASLSPTQKKAVMELIETCFLNKSGGVKTLLARNGVQN